MLTLLIVAKKINLTSHETHLQAQIQAGINPNGPILTPMELTVIKERKDREIRAAGGAGRVLLVV